MGKIQRRSKGLELSTFFTWKHRQPFLLFALFFWQSKHSTLIRLIIVPSTVEHSTSVSCLAGRGQGLGVGRHEEGTSKMLGGSTGLGMIIDASNGGFADVPRSIILFDNYAFSYDKRKFICTSGNTWLRSVSWLRAKMQS